MSETNTGAQQYDNHGGNIKHTNGAAWLLVFVMKVEDPVDFKKSQNMSGNGIVGSGSGGSHSHRHHHSHHHTNHHRHHHHTTVSDPYSIVHGWPSLASLSAFR